MALASKKEILEHLDSIDLNELLDRMENYVRTRFYNKSEKEREGFDYLDFCYNVLVKASTGVRNWDKGKTSFDKLDEVETVDEPPDIDFKDISQDTLKSLREQGADKLEIEVFECWLVGYYKPKEIAELCGIDVAEVNNAVKRLSRKTIKLKEKWISLKKL